MKTIRVMRDGRPATKEELDCAVEGKPLPAPRGRSIRTFTGVEFFPLDPRPEEIAIEDIAHALSMQCRFGGHSFFFYSVAQHSLRASNIVPPADALAALLHDAAEAYLVDVPSPVKAELNEYRAIEDRLMEVIAAKFGFQWPLPPTVKAADEELLRAEQRDLFVRSLNWKTPTSVLGSVYPLNQGPAKMRFLERFDELTDTNFTNSHEAEKPPESKI